MSRDHLEGASQLHREPRFQISVYQEQEIKSKEIQTAIAQRFNPIHKKASTKTFYPLTSQPPIDILNEPTSKILDHFSSVVLKIAD